jgi:hypothetical protein
MDSMKSQLDGFQGCLWHRWLILREYSIYRIAVSSVYPTVY